MLTKSFKSGKKGGSSSRSRLSKTITNFKSQTSRNGSFFKKYKKFRVKTEPSPRKAEINYKRVNYLKDLHILPDKNERIKSLRLKDEKILHSFKTQMSHKKIDDQDIVNALKNTSQMKNKLKILDAAVSYKQIEEV